MENKDNQRESSNTTVRRVGTYTFGIMLVMFGITLMLGTFTKLDVMKYVFMFWPSIFILLGIEIIISARQKNVAIKYDILGMIMVISIIFFGSIFGVINYGVNKIIYNKDINEQIVQCIKENKCHITLNGNT